MVPPCPTYRYRLGRPAFALQYHLYRLYHPLSTFGGAVEFAEAPVWSRPALAWPSVVNMLPDELVEQRLRQRFHRRRTQLRGLAVEVAVGLDTHKDAARDT